ncbi:hypothetical protein Pmani_020987 [Petrolisthes manimaculis]|uniref:Uncharacterized protein n=1 Tax=Petrolisthes manimaculis TaxID=1843537 RepID=A0AAE1PFQ5_9EUCA|nr:hypothetical protein Pmani_020987 [Petrolisthes manimaculis]
MSAGWSRMVGGYGEVMAESGYGSQGGYGVSRYVDCNSALALLGFILFIDLLRDIIEDVTDDAMERRRKRRGLMEGHQYWDIMEGGEGGGGIEKWDTEGGIWDTIGEKWDTIGEKWDTEEGGEGRGGIWDTVRRIWDTERDANKEGIKKWDTIKRNWDTERDANKEGIKKWDTIKRNWDTEEEEGGEGEGKERTWDTEPDLLTFLNEGGPNHLYHTLPHIITPLMAGWGDMGEGGGGEKERGERGEGVRGGEEERPKHHQCVEQSVCQANWVLSSHYGTTGRILATLLSNVASRAFSRGNERVSASTLVAARTGRRRYQDCETAFPACPSLPSQHTQSLYPKKNNTTTINSL